MANLSKKISELEELAKQATKAKTKEEKIKLLGLFKEEASKYVVDNPETKKYLSESIRHATEGHSKQTLYHIKKLKKTISAFYNK